MDICLHNTGKKVAILNDIVSTEAAVEEVNNTRLVYRYEDKASGHFSKTGYEMVTLRRDH